jgi:transposase
MLLSQPTYAIADERDQEIFRATVRDDHYLRRVKALIDFERFRGLLASTYSPDQGRPAIEPLLLLKLEFLQYQYNHSDRQVIEQARCNMAYRFFLDLGLHSPLPHHTLLTYFRQRLGVERHQEIFDALVGQAREHGLVKDRLRLKDATHVIANIAIPTTIVLVAQARERLLQALASWAADDVEQQRQRAAQIRASTADLAGEERLLQRVVHLRELVAWAQTVSSSASFTSAAPAEQAPLQQALAVAAKILDDRDDPQERDQLRSVQDPDARRAKHGHYYDGYLLDVAVDADSQLITAINVLPGGANEAADAATLLQREEQAHGNDVQAISLDAAGFQGPVLHTLTDPAGPHVEVFTPPRAPNRVQEFPPEQFTLSADQRTLTCPAGQTTTSRYRHPADGWQFSFARATCAACPLQARCAPQLPKGRGRTVFKSDYEADLQAARVKAQTPEYAQVRREHPAVERKLAELVRRHGARQARYWGQKRVLLQQLVTGWVVNIKRVVHLLGALAASPAGTVRAEVVASG